MATYLDAARGLLLPSEVPKLNIQSKRCAFEGVLAGALVSPLLWEFRDGINDYLP